MHSLKRTSQMSFAGKEATIPNLNRTIQTKPIGVPNSSSNLHQYPTFQPKPIGIPNSSSNLHLNLNSPKHKKIRLYMSPPPTAQPLENFENPLLDPPKESNDLTFGSFTDSEYRVSSLSFNSPISNMPALTRESVDMRNSSILNNSPLHSLHLDIGVVRLNDPTLFHKQIPLVLPPFAKESTVTTPLAAFTPTSSSSVFTHSKDEEVDAHKEGTERTARVAIRRAIQTNQRLVKDYKLETVLGWGGNGVVLGCHRNLDNKPCAIKLIYKRKESEVAPTDTCFRKTRFENLPSEIKILMQMKGTAGILEFIEWFEDFDSFFIVTERVESNWGLEHQKDIFDDDDIDEEECISIRHYWSAPYLVRMAIRSGSSDLFSYIDISSTVPKENIRSIFSKVALALGELHEQGITHGDIKEENILLSNSLETRLCDFGHARIRERDPSTNKFIKRIGFYGTRDMTAPELLPNLKKRDLNLEIERFSGFEADVWALGLLLHSMCFGTLGNMHKEFVKDVIKGDYRRRCYPCLDPEDEECLDVMRGMLCVDFSKRLTINQVLRHNFIFKFS